MNKFHNVKSWPHFFQAILEGKKLHDLRRNDRDFQVGDTLCLREYDPAKGLYTGRQCFVTIKYITDERWPCAFSSAVLDKGYCILSIERQPVSL